MIIGKHMCLSVVREADGGLICRGSLTESQAEEVVQTEDCDGVLVSFDQLDLKPEHLKVLQSLAALSEAIGDEGADLIGEAFDAVILAAFKLGQQNNPAQ